MTHDACLFETLDKSFISKVKIKNGEFVEVQGKGDVVIKTFTGTKLIFNMLYILKLN